jgi:polyhydroxyalkanoate synthase
MAPKRELTKAAYLAKNILDTEALGRTEPVDDFIASMPGYPGRAYHQIHSRLMTRNELATGRVQLSRERIGDISRIATRVLLIGSATDNIGPARRCGPRSTSSRVRPTPPPTGSATSDWWPGRRRRRRAGR